MVVKRIAAIALATLLLMPALAHAFEGADHILYGWEEGYGFWDGTRGREAWHVERGIKLGDRMLHGCTEDLLAEEESSCQLHSYRAPAFAPDGERVVFDAGESLAMVNADGTGFHTLPARSEDDGAPRFSPAGTRVVFSSGLPYRTGRRAQRSIWISDVDGGRARRVVPDGDAPDWSVRGWIAFVHRRTIYRVRPDGTGLKLLARRAVAPAWSPDGRTLAVSYLGVWDRAGRSIRRGGVLLMDAQGRHRRLVHPAGVDDPGSIAWSPNGRRLLILPYDLMTIDLRGRLIRNHGSGEASGADYGHETYGIDWRPHRR